MLNVGKSLKIISLFPQNLGVNNFFVLWASQDTLQAKSLMPSMMISWDCTPRDCILGLYPQGWPMVGS
jgi:hypothetical protein